LKQALEQAGKIGDKVTVNKILNEQILNNFYGFELLVAPYVIAHLKISEFLKEQGFTIEKGKRLNIFLTNTLNNDEPESFPIMPSLSKEGREANKIKNKDILIITGNPPYSGHSANVNDWIQDKMKIYYEVDGKPLGERNPKWLQDDYVKFLRFAQWKIDSVERGVVGVITNHGFLDNPTFRGMRKALMRSFDEIYIIDLHGNAKKKEKCPDGSKDENVFDIQQGVAITLFVKRHSKESICQVHHFELFGLRQNKYDLLWQMDILNIKWNKANPNTPHYLFKPRNESFLKNYDEFISLKEIFNLNGVGITTAHDEFVIDFDKEILLKRFREFQKSLRNEEQLHQYFKVKKKKGWSILRGYDEIKDEYNLNKYLKKINYRPFDDRWIFYQNRLVWRTVKNLMTNMKDENIALMTNKREELDLPWSHSLVTQYLSEHGSMSSKTTNYHFPLYIISEEETFLGVKESALGYNTEKILIEGEQKTENFIEEFRNFIDNKYKDYNSPEQILGYIYAILHSPTYREKYIEFLKIDFPRIPFTDDENMFRQLSEIGWELIQHHLLKINYKDNISRFEGGDNCKVEKVSYDKGKVWINNDRYFDNVPQAIWEFYIGGYQVLDKWLKERKKHEITLSTEDFRHFIKVVNVIDYTIKTMEKIDELTGEWV
jgi:predicted helicase